MGRSLRQKRLHSNKLSCCTPARALGDHVGLAQRRIWDCIANSRSCVDHAGACVGWRRGVRAAGASRKARSVRPRAPRRQHGRDRRGQRCDRGRRAAAWHRAGYPGIRGTARR
jgi:hypothetical protein